MAYRNCCGHLLGNPSLHWISLPLYFPLLWTQFLGLPPPTSRYLWNWIVLPHGALHCCTKYYVLGMTSSHMVAAGPRERGYSALFVCRKRKVLTSPLFMICQHFPFHPGKQARVVRLLVPESTVLYIMQPTLSCSDLHL